MKKRVLSLLLCVALLLSSVALLSSCKKNEEGPDASRMVVELALTGYTVITGVELTDLGDKHVFSFTQSVSNLLGVDMGVLEDAEADIVENKVPEVLIGETSRKESQDTLEDIKGVGWAIRVFPKTNKVAIVGTTPYLTRVALSYFERTYLNAEHASEKLLSVNKKVVNSEMETLSLVDTVDGQDVPFTVVRDEYALGISITSNHDYPYDLQKDILTTLAEKTGIPAFETLSSDAAVAKEILCGNMERPEMKEEIGKLAVDQAALTIRDGKILLAAWSDKTLQNTKALFDDMMICSTVIDEAGNVTYQIPNNCTVVENCANKWVTDFPRPTGENIYPHGAVDAGNNFLQYIYAGSGVTREAFVAYCETLKAAGYTALGNEDVQWEGSSFRTFINKETNVSLNVSHMAFSHAEEQKDNQDQTLDMLNSIRIVAGTLEGLIGQVDEQYFRPQVAGTEEQVKNGEADYVYRMNSRVTANHIDPDVTWGFGQIITLADGSFIIIDGGRRDADFVPNFKQMLWNLHEEAHGEEPTQENPVHIRAWVITHGHGDHKEIFQAFCQSYGEEPALRIDYVMQNCPSDTQSVSCGFLGLNMAELEKRDGQVTNGFKYVPVQTGQVFYFANCRLEVLYTIDDVYPLRMNHRQNNFSTVVRTVLIESDDQGNTHESGCLWTGDIEQLASIPLVAMYGDFLQSEQVSVAHHGVSTTATSAFYSLIKPTVIWFPEHTSSGSLNKMISKGASAYAPLGSHNGCELIIFQGKQPGKGAKPSPTLIVTATGLAYDRIYNAMAGENDRITPTATLSQVVDVKKLKGN